MARGARARLTVVLGEQRRWAEAQPLLVTGEAGAAFSALVSCAYGPDIKACGAVAVCDQAQAVALTAYAGAWCATRACIVAARRTGDTAAATELQKVLIRFPRLHKLRGGLDAGIVVVGLAAAVVIWTRRNRRRPPPLALSAPWSFGELYAALLRCLLWSLLVSLPVVGLLAIARVPVHDSVGVVLYLVGFLWIVRIVFRRWGLSWRDSLGWRAGQEVGLTLAAAVGLSRGGGMCIALGAFALRHRLPWTDLPEPVDPTSRWRLAASILGTAVLPPLLELVFRRALLTRLGRRFSPSTAIPLSTLLFTLPHGYSPVGLLTIFWSGLVFAWAFHRTSNLWPGLAAHAYGNRHRRLVEPDVSRPGAARQVDAVRAARAYVLGDGAQLGELLTEVTSGHLCRTPV